jgi:lysine biosynthesis protein LysW
MAKKKAASKKAAKKASKKKPSRESPKKRATTEKQKAAVIVACPSCDAPINLAGCEILERVECEECSSELEVVKKGVKLGLSIEFSDID